MKKVLLALLVLGMSVSVALATDTRVSTLLRNYLKDDIDIYTWPGCVIDYPRLSIVDYGQYGAYLGGEYQGGSVGLLYTNSEEQPYGVFGLIFHRKPGGFDEFSEYLTCDSLVVPTQTGGETITKGNELPDTRFDVFWGKKFSNIGFGVHLEQAGASWKHEKTDTAIWHGGADSSLAETDERSSSILGIGLGASVTAGENINADLGFHYRKYGFSTEFTRTCTDTVTVNTGNWKLESDGGSGMSLGLRVFYPMSENFKLVPLFGFSNTKFGWKYSQSDTFLNGQATKNEFTTSTFGGGIGLWYKPTEEALLVLAPAISSGKIEEKTTIKGEPVQKSETSYFTLPGFYFAGEVTLTRWLVLRMGGSKNLLSKTEKPTLGALQTKNETTSSSAPMDFAFGLGFKFGNLGIDVRLNEELPFNLGYFMSGTSGNPVTKVSATYKF